MALLLLTTLQPGHLCPKACWANPGQAVERAGPKREERTQMHCKNPQSITLGWRCPEVWGLLTALVCLPPHFEKALFWGVILHLQLHAHCPGVNSSLLWNCVWSGSPKLGIMDPIQPPLYTLGHFWAIFVTFGSAKPQARQCHCRQPVPSQCRHLGQRCRRARIKTNCHVHTETALAMSQFDGNGANECKQFSNVRKQSKVQK